MVSARTVTAIRVHNSGASATLVFRVREETCPVEDATASPRSRIAVP